MTLIVIGIVLANIMIWPLAAWHGEFMERPEYESRNVTPVGSERRCRCSGSEYAWSDVDGLCAGNGILRG